MDKADDLRRMTKEFEGKVALVTGGARGIGQACAVAFARRGASVAVCDIDEYSEETVSLIEKMGGKAIYIRMDVSDPQSVQEGIKKTISTFGRLDFAHNNAGVRAVALTADLSEEDWRRVIDINLTGVFLCMKYEIPEILKTKGAIVNTASIWGMTGAYERSAYVASKAGVIGLTKTAASEYGEQGIRINAIAPGPILTSAALKTLSEGIGLDAVVSKTAMKRAGKPEEIAEAVTWLCSSASSYVNGVVLPVDGGWSAT